MHPRWVMARTAEPRSTGWNWISLGRKLTGWQPQDHVRDLLSMAHVMTLPSTTSANGKQGIPVALWVTMAIQVPVIATILIGNTRLCITNRRRSRTERYRPGRLADHRIHNLPKRWQKMAIKIIAISIFTRRFETASVSSLRPRSSSSRSLVNTLMGGCADVVLLFISKGLRCAFCRRFPALLTLGVPLSTCC